jgi:hypothetical protein
LQLDATPGEPSLCTSRAVKNDVDLFAGLFGRPALGAVAADLKSCNYDVELAIPLNLSLQSVEQVTFKFGNLTAAETCHVNVIPLRTPLVVVLFALHVHQVQFINQSMSLEQAEGTINSDAINLGIEAPGAAQQLAGVEMLLGGFDHAENGATLTGHA